MEAALKPSLFDAPMAKLTNICAATYDGPAHPSQKLLTNPAKFGALEDDLQHTRPPPALRPHCVPLLPA